MGWDPDENSQADMVRKLSQAAAPAASAMERFSEAAGKVGRAIGMEPKIDEMPEPRATHLSVSKLRRDLHIPAATTFEAWRFEDWLKRTANKVSSISTGMQVNPANLKMIAEGMRGASSLILVLREGAPLVKRPPLPESIELHTDEIREGVRWSRDEMRMIGRLSGDDVKVAHMATVIAALQDKLDQAANLIEALCDDDDDD